MLFGAFVYYGDVSGGLLLPDGHGLCDNQSVPRGHVEQHDGGDVRRGVLESVPARLFLRRGAVVRDNECVPAQFVQPKRRREMSRPRLLDGAAHDGNERLRAGLLLSARSGRAAALPCGHV